MASLQSALHDARRRLDSVEHRAGLSEDGLVNETLSVLAECWPEKVLEAAAALTRSPAVAPFATYAAAYVASPVAAAAAPKAKIKPSPSVAGGADKGGAATCCSCFYYTNSHQDLLSLQNPKVRS